MITDNQSPYLTADEKDTLIHKLYKALNVELDRLLIVSAESKIAIMQWIIGEYQNRKWVTVHTRQVIGRDIQIILGNDAYRDFMFELTNRFVSECIAEGPGLYNRLIGWRVATASIFTNLKPLEQRVSFLNMEVFETLQVDDLEYRQVLEDNPWLMVYGLLLEHLHQWPEFADFIRSVLKDRQKPQEPTE